MNRGVAGRALVLLGTALGLAVGVAGCADDRDERPASWSYISVAIIVPNCGTVGCHSRHTATYGLQLDTREGAYSDLVGGNFVVPGRPDASKLVHLLRGDEVLTQMPPDNPLPAADLDLIERWILDGAQDN